MKSNLFTIYILLFLINFIPIQLFADEDELDGTSFITVWKTDNLSGGSNSTSITIPTRSYHIYNYDIDFNNDGKFEVTGVRGDYTHDFGEAGTYTIRIRGEFPSIYFHTDINDEERKDNLKLLEVKQWGNLSFRTFYCAFEGCGNLKITAKDVPDLSNVCSMSKMFYKARNLTGDLSSWDVSNVTSMNYMFYEAMAFTSNLNSWDVSNVMNMSGMFYEARSFNSDLSSWDVSKVRDMSHMFCSAISFTRDLDSWDVSNVRDMSHMFYVAKTFNGDISSWDVSGVTDMNDMFYCAEKFTGDLSSWDVSNVTNMSGIFSSASNFNSDLSSWDVSNVTNMSSMFSGTSFTGDLSSWDVSSVTGMCHMFRGISNFTGDLSSWDVSNVTDMSGMFSGTNFTGDLSSWDVSNVTDMSGVFSDTNFTGDLSSWDVSNVTNMSGMFSGTSFTGDLSSWDVSNVTDMSDMFSFASSFNGDLSSWDVSSVTNMHGMFHGASSFNGDLSSWDVSNVVHMIYMFDGASSFIGDLSSWDVSSVTDMRGMFDGASSFNGNLSSWDVSNVWNMSGMFRRASSFNGDLSFWDMSSVTNMHGMFDGASSFNGDLSSWDVSNVTSLCYMFDGASSFNGDLSSWDVSEVIDFMFFLDSTSYSVDNYNKLLITWSEKEELVRGVEFNARSIKYKGALAASARQKLIDDYGWNIVDGGECIILPAQKFSIAENANNNDVIGSVKSDKDNNGQLQDWTVISGNSDGVFGINSNNGELFVADNSKLNYDAAKQYTLSITVSDGENTSAEEEVIINITDFNYKPVITSGQSFSILENANNTDVVGSVAATDKDSNTTLSSYVIASGNEDGVFGINPDNGELFVADNSKLNYDDTKQYTLVITVSDGVNTSEEETVTINITDFNYKPVITSGQSFSILENANNNDVVGIVAATDKDSNTTLSTYTIVSGNEDGVFGINADNGELFVADNSKLNYDDAKQYTLSITVSDGVNTSEEGIVIVNVTDFNYPAVITAGQSFDIAENANIDDIVGEIQVTDRDKNAVYSFTIVSGNEDGVFGINPNNGELFVADNSNLNYDAAKQYTLGITVSDGVNTSEEGTVIVNVTDFNYKPVITLGQSFEIAENANNNDVVGNILATDQNPNTTLSSYTIASGDEDGVFGINSDNGELFISDNTKLNYDDANQYTLGITVSDGVNTSEEGTVTINVTDFNYAPVIEASQTFTVEEEVDNGLIVGMIKASDKDENDQLQNWTIVSGNESGVFAVNEDGALCIKDKSNVGNRKDLKYTLSVTVSDGQATSEAVELVVNIINYTGLSEVSQIVDYKLVPNPAKDHFSIVSNAFAYPIEVEIVDITGHVVVTPIQYNKGDQMSIQLKAGIYFVKIIEEGNLPQVKRLIIK
ncbi:MAG: BspA family leucine-rich repeat surface protein [Hyphomicrobiales bacterium]